MTYVETFRVRYTYRRRAPPELLSVELAIGPLRRNPELLWGYPVFTAQLSDGYAVRALAIRSHSSSSGASQVGLLQRLYQYPALPRSPSFR